MIRFGVRLSAGLALALMAVALLAVGDVRGEEVKNSVGMTLRLL